jgi:hypothetical protein
MKLPYRVLRLALTCAAAIAAPVHGIALYTNTDLLPLQNDFTVATCYSSTALANLAFLPLPDPEGNVVVVWNTSPSLPNGLTGKPMGEPASAGANWHYYHNELAQQNPVAGVQHEWKAKHLGEVFGTALDDSIPPNIFVAASKAYGYSTWPAGNGPGTVYKLGAANGAITAFPQLPGAAGGTPGPGSGNSADAALGNLCFHRTPGGTAWLYVTNMGDGKIYRMDPVTGANTGSFDHGTQALPVASYPSVSDNPALVYTQPTRRPWGIGVQAGRLYYSIFDSMDPWPLALHPNAVGPQPEVWSVALDSAGNFQPATALREFKLPPLSLSYSGFGPLGRSSMPVSDIEFTLSGAMVLAERYHTGCTSPFANGSGSWNQLPNYLLGAHSTRVLEYTGSSGSWVASPQNKFRVGSNPWGNSAGGVGPGCDGSVWCTGDALGVFQSLAAYGQQRIRGQGNATDVTPLVQSYIIDYDCSGIYYGKSLIGDVDTVTEPLRVRATFVSAVCPPVPGAPYQVTLNITNLMQVPLTQVGFGPCPPQFLPPGGQSLVPSPPLVNVTIPPGGNANITVTMTALPIGGIKCFSIQGNPADFSSGGAGHEAAFLCSPKVCVQLPKCPCLTANLANPLCPVYEGQEHSATLTITNLWNVAADNWQMLPCPQNELPAGAITLQPSPAGIQAFSPPLAPNSTSPPINVTFPGLPVQNTAVTVCFIVQLLPQDWEHEGPFCEAKVCLTFPPCPPLLPCVSGTIGNVQCPTAPPGNYTMNLTITNLGPVPAASATLTPCAPVAGGIPANPSPPFIALPPLNQNQSGTYPIQLGGVGTSGALACFCLTLNDANGRPLCSTVICQQLPPCPCATFGISGITCPQYEGQPYNAVVTVTNTGFNPLYWIGFLPCPQAQLPSGALPGIGVGPAGIQPLPPLGPGNSLPVPITLTGIPKAGGLVCFTVRVFGQMEGQPLCQEKLCFNVPPCPPCLPCMNASATAAQCPVVQGGPFTTNLTITNLQPVPAVTAQLVPCLPGLQAGEVAATPTPGTIALPPLLQNQSQSYAVSLSGVNSGQIACFCVRLLDASGKVLCEQPVCLTLPFCPPLCATVSPVEVVCPQGGNGYSAFLNILNQSATTFFNYQTCPVPVGSLPAGAMTGQPSPAGIAPLNPPITPNTTGGAPVQLPNNLPATGGTFCFIIKFFGQSDNLICQQMVCLQLPPCMCGMVLDHRVDCVPGPGGLKRQLTITVQNLTNVFGPAFNFDVATIAPGAGFSPAVIVPNPNPIPPGGTGTLTTCFLGNKPPACIHILLTNSARTLCCPLKLCPLWVECAQEPLHPDRCDLAPQFTSENGGTAPATAWIFNGTGSPKSYTFTITPASVPGCTGTLPPVAFFPASGVTLPVGAYSSLGINFSISGTSLLPGQCAGFQICFQEVGPAVPPPPVCCVSKLKRSNNTDICVDWNPTGRSIPVGAGLKTIVIKNPTSAALPVSLLLVQSGGVEFSLTGEYAPPDFSGAGGPPVDYDAMPIELLLGPHESVPLSFTARVKAIPYPGPGPGPVWSEWQLLKRCGVLPYDPVDVGVDDPHTMAAAVFHVPSLQPPSPAPPLSLRDFSFLPGVAGPAEWTSFQSAPGEILHPQSANDLENWLPEAVIPYASVQAADGSIAGTGETLWSFRVQPDADAGTAPPRRNFHRFFGD